MIEILLRVFEWLNEHPERWVPVVLTALSVLAVKVRGRYPRLAHVLDVLIELGPNLPGAIDRIKHPAEPSPKLPTPPPGGAP